MNLNLPFSVMKGKSYKPFGGGKKKAVITRAAMASGSRVEEYMFKSRYGGESTVDAFISQEMHALAHDNVSKLEQLEGTKWGDRTNSLLSQPLSAEDMFLSSDRGNRALRFQGTRFFHEELWEKNEDDSGNLRPPNIDRFPYSSEANAASATLANKLAKNLSRRHYAAATLQRNYRLMVSLRNFRKEVVEAHTASRKIQWFWRKRLARTRKKRQQKNLERGAVIRIQAQIRRFLAAQKVQQKKIRLIQYNAKLITRFIRFSGREIKRKRGRETRGNVHATRIQARARGVAGRKRVRRMKTSVDLILKIWRAYWARKKGPHGKRMVRALRRSILAKKVMICQRILRGFLAQRQCERKRHEMVAYERKRVHAEQVAIGRALVRAVASHDFSWVEANGGGNLSPQHSPPKRGTSSKPPASTYTMTSKSESTIKKNVAAGSDQRQKQPPHLPDLKYSGNEVRGTDVVDFMELLDVMCNQIMFDSDKKLNGGKGLDKRILCIDPDFSVSNLPVRRRITLAVLAAFSSHPGGMIHWTALRQCKDFLNAVQVKTFKDGIDLKQDTSKESSKLDQKRDDCESAMVDEKEINEEEELLPNVPSDKKKADTDKFDEIRAETYGNISPSSSKVRDKDDNPVDLKSKGKVGYEPYQPRDVQKDLEEAEEAQQRGLPFEEAQDARVEEERANQAKTEAEEEAGAVDLKIDEGSGEMDKSHPHIHARHHKAVEMKPGMTSDEVWQSLEDAGPLISIVEASRWLEPSLALRCRVSVQGHLPDKLLATAVIVRRWTHWVENIIKRAIWTSRRATPVPKRECPFCLESLLTPASERAHYPCQNNQWAAYCVPKVLYKPVLIALHNRVGNLTAYPNLKRSKAEKDRQHLHYKLKARNDEAYRAHKVTSSADVDDEWEQRQVQVNAERFIKLMRGAVQERKDEESAEEVAHSLSTGTHSPKKKASAQATPNNATNGNISPPGIDARAIKEQERVPPSPPKPPSGVEHVSFVEEFVPKAKDLFHQWNHDEELRLEALEAGLDSPAGAKSPSSGSPFSKPQKGTILVFTKAGDFVGDVDVDEVSASAKKSPKKDKSPASKRDRKVKKGKGWD